MHACTKRARAKVSYTLIIHEKVFSTRYLRSINVSVGIVEVGEDFSEAPLVLDDYGIL